MSIAHLAIDLGASSGRAVVGVLDESLQTLTLEEVHRFQHHACPTPTGPAWDLTGIWRNILQGLGKAATWCQEVKAELKSIGVDTWGVDWALLGSSGELLSLPHCYRDPQNETACQRALEKIGGFERLYERTGIQLMPFNTLFQYAARFDQEPQLFDAAQHLVFLPDLFHYWLSGEIVTELSIVSTSSMLAVDTGTWDRDLLDQLGLPHELLGSIVEPGTIVGTLRKEIASETGTSAEIKVITPASHDTASAVAAVPATGGQNWAYLSSGTWSLLGVELSSPIYSAAAREVPFTNERGVGGTIRFLKNIAGLWLVQELHRDLELAGKPLSFHQLAEEARLAEPGRTIIDPNFPEFAIPGGIQEKIRNFARNTQQPEPKTAGQMARCCFESLALCYAATLHQLEEVVGHTVEVLHIVGGGIQNELLNELTAAAIGRTVVAGPIEATAIGNLLVQAIGCGEVSGLKQLRTIVADSFSPRSIKPSSDLNVLPQKSKYDEILSATPLGT
ncbi:MAG: rhamnulokinase [Pirellulales bacterium]|nr:rhamnulokinase [Pirellulales bacterium]